MIKTNFYLKSDKQNSAGETHIYLKIQLQGQSTTLATGKYINKERWLATNMLRNTLRAKDEKNCKTAIDTLKTHIESTYYELLKKDINVSLQDVKNTHRGIDIRHTNMDIIALFGLHNIEFKKKYERGERSKASLQKYNRAKTLLAQFVRLKHHKTTLDVNDIDNQFIFQLESYLKFESNHNSKIGIGHNSVVKYFQCFKTVLKYGIKRDYITKNPFLIYDEKLKIKDAVFLTKKELEKIEMKEFESERLNRVKDIFLFSCFTSYAPVDAEKLTRENIVENSDGTSWILNNRSKTNIKSNVPILPPVKRIIEKYASLEGDKILPRISNQKMNEYLKEIAVICGINKNLTHYVARHTFATTVTLGNGVAIENVSSMMGHTRISMTQHYAKVMEESVQIDMEKVSEKYR